MRRDTVCRLIRKIDDVIQLEAHACDSEDYLDGMRHIRQMVTEEHEKVDFCNEHLPAVKIAS